MKIFENNKSKLTTISFRVKEDEKAIITAFIKEKGYNNITDFIKDLIKREIEG